MINAIQMCYTRVQDEYMGRSSLITSRLLPVDDTFIPCDQLWYQCCANVLHVQDEYMAPEMLFDEDFSQSADMYSFGMVLLELISRRKIGDGRKVRGSLNGARACMSSPLRTVLPLKQPMGANGSVLTRRPK
jgi:serine/threonine protein kinase